MMVVCPGQYSWRMGKRAVAANDVPIDTGLLFFWAGRHSPGWVIFGALWRSQRSAVCPDAIHQPKSTIGDKQHISRVHADYDGKQ